MQAVKAKKRSDQIQKETRVKRNARRMKSVTGKKLITHEDRVFELRIRRGETTEDEIKKWIRE